MNQYLYKKEKNLRNGGKQKPLGSLAYKLIAANRRSVFVRALSKLLEKLS